MNPFSKIKESLFSIFQIALIVLLVALVVIFVVVMSSENPDWIFNLLGIAENGEFKIRGFEISGHRHGRRLGRPASPDVLQTRQGDGG